MQVKQVCGNMEEIWRPVVGYEGLYEVSNLGQVQGYGSDDIDRV